MKQKIILVEDDKKKIQDIREYLEDEYQYKELVVKESYQSGLREILNGDFDLLLLDMSIPTWDKSVESVGGDYQKFGGYMIMKELKRKSKLLPTILISMFDDFGESDRSITLTQIDEILKEEYPDFYLGAVFYSSGQTGWKSNLKTFIKDL